MPFPNPEILTTDVAVIGAGGAGLRASGLAAAGGLSVTCISKVPPTRSHTVAAQGGINAALGNRLPDDWQWHMYDTIRGSDWLGDQDIIAHLCESAPGAIVELEHMGMPFTRDENGHIYQRAYGGQYQQYGKGGPAYRACAVADRTGHSLLYTLYAEAQKSGVQFYSECIALDLLMDQHGACRGVLIWDLKRGELSYLLAHRVILATGGFGQAWQATTSSSICTGDGGGMAMRAGLAMQDMEFVQFHPTSLPGTGVLITEGARGEGGYLRNALDERFMAAYAPKSMELASRDVISRAMAMEIHHGRGGGPDGQSLYLDVTHLPETLLQEKLPSVLDLAQTFMRVDARHGYIPIQPAVHYTMGGIPTNRRCEVILPFPLPVREGASGRGMDATGTPHPSLPPQGGKEQIVPGLMAIGEAACASVHGANRLGCNALLELVVLGKQAAETCLSDIPLHSAAPELRKDSTEAAVERLQGLLKKKGATRPGIIRTKLREVMQRHAGIYRNEALMRRGADALETLAAQFEEDLSMADTSLLWNNELVEAYETHSLLLQARATLHAARSRHESRGAHWHEDYPERDDTVPPQHSLVYFDEAGHLACNTRPVTQLRDDNRDLRFPPEARHY